MQLFDTGMAAMRACRFIAGARRRADRRRAGVPWGLLPLVTLALALVAPPSALQAQYFGRNKVQYEDFDFKVMQTSHFDIHFYPEEELAVRDAGRMAERWYERLSRLFQHQFSDRKPIILYANQGDFQQTYVISEMIGEGTGGFTEPIKDRVVLPMTGSYRDNDHVIGHELVHAFQYDISQYSGEAGLNKMNMLPLWFVEGMAEYLSLGRNDPNTAMWLRDVVLRDEIPTIDDITRDSRYFPYRYGQAIWSYIAGRWGDTVVPRLFRSAVTGDLDFAIQRILGLSIEQLSNDWIASIRAAYGTSIAARMKPDAVGRRILADEDGLTIAPSVSPDGRSVIFLSSRDIFSIDLYLADANSGEVITKLLSAETNPHFDALRFINSSGSWSPDGRKFAFVTYVKGDDELAILDIASRDIEQQIHINGVGELSNPNWSPDGGSIVFSGSAGGISDLYTVELASRKVQRLTNDRNADLQPVWSPDGKTIAFVTDRGAGTDFTRLSYGTMGIATISAVGGASTELPLFTNGKNINPQFTPDGKGLYFISDQDGFSDIYRYDLASSAISRVTRVATGVSGIATLSPAVSVARTSGRLMFSVFQNGDYGIHSLEPAEATGQAVASLEGTAGADGILPPTDARGRVEAYLNDPITGLPPQGDSPVVPYQPSIKLDYLGTPTLGVAIGPGGAGFGGAVAGYFSDMLGYHHIGAALQVNGSFADIGGEVYYQYNKNRWIYGVDVAHIPYASGYTTTGSTIIDIGGGVQAPAATVTEVTQRVYVDRLMLTGAYPFSTINRAEFNVGYTRQSYTQTGIEYTIYRNEIVGETERDFDTPPGLNLLEATTAYVGDYSFFGLTSPVAGGRYRFEVGGTAGSLRFATVLLDYRQYFFVRPVTFALRGLHYGRYGGDADNDLISPLFIGYESYVRGYTAESFDPAECTGPNCPEFERLLGSKVGLVSAEFRVPLFGTSQFGLINFPYLPTEIAAFVDGGAAWTATESPVLKFERNSSERVPVFSAGVTARANLFGYFVLEVFYAYPFQRPDAGWQFGFQLAPGW